MTQEHIGLEDLKAAMMSPTTSDSSAGFASSAEFKESIRPLGPQIDAQGRAYATGKRKQSIARVWIKPGSGKILVNGRESQIYFARPVSQMILNQPFKIVNREAQFDIVCTVTGGGLSGQAGAIRHGTCKALVAFDPEFRMVLKREGLITRDSRQVERKKYGQKKARKRFQFSKR